MDTLVQSRVCCEPRAFQEEISVPELRFVPAEPAHLQEKLGNHCGSVCGTARVWIIRTGRGGWD